MFFCVAGCFAHVLLSGPVGPDLGPHLPSMTSVGLSENMVPKKLRDDQDGLVCAERALGSFRAQGTCWGLELGAWGTTYFCVFKWSLKIGDPENLRVNTKFGQFCMIWGYRHFLETSMQEPSNFSNHMLTCWPPCAKNRKPPPWSFWYAAFLLEWAVCVT